MSGIIGGAGSKSGVIGQTEGGTEVGSYTNVINIGGGTSTNDASNGRMFYSRSGKFCTIWGLVTSASHSTTGNIRLRLPFPVRSFTGADGNARGSAHMVVAQGATAYSDRALRLDEGLSSVYVYPLLDGYVTSTNAEFTCCFTYAID